MYTTRPKSVTLVVACAILLLIASLLTACKSIPPRNLEADMPSDSGTDAPTEASASPELTLTLPEPEEPSATPSDDLLAQGYFIVDSDDNYTIYALSREGGGYVHYRYRIGAEEPYLAEGIYDGTTCAMDYINGILRLLIGSGNVREIQYFDLDKEKRTELIWLDSQSTEYIDPAGEHYLIAYITFDTSKKGIPAYLMIKDIFTNEIIAIIERPFNRGTAPLNELCFVDENEIYIDYDRDFIDGKYVGKEHWVNEKETIAFR